MGPYFSKFIILLRISSFHFSVPRHLSEMIGV